MRFFILLTTFLILFNITDAQTHHSFIIVDQFGYLPDANKIAVIKNPQVGFDSEDEYSPGEQFALVDAQTHEQVFNETAVAWKAGTIDASSGDQVWHFNFSEYTETGTYYVLDIENNYRSYEFEISSTVYNEVLKHAVRIFFYQRAGFAKEAEYAGEEWADGASHTRNLQDYNARYYAEKSNAAKERDVSGGWYDAGDYNKYTNWTADYVAEMMLIYLENPNVWGDDYGIPESGNGIPDLIDEAKWGVDHLLRLQNDDGSMISIVGLAHASPPSAATGASYYGSPNTSGTLTSAAAFAISSKVFRSLGFTQYADSLLLAAEKAWDWADANPSVIFRNNDSSQGTSGLGAGQQEVNDYGRLTKKLRAAVYLFEVTGNTKYRTFFDNNYRKVNMFEWNFSFPFQSTNQEMVLYYANLPNATQSVATDIKNVYRNTMINGSENFPAINNFTDPYMAHIKDYTWGSNSIKCRQGYMFYALHSYNVDPQRSEQAIEVAREYLHYIHGRNPLNMVYLSNMYSYGAKNSVNEFYHSWFADGSAKWDRVGESLYGPAPGFLVGGPNPSYDWDGCCPSGCGSANNNQLCFSESIEPPINQPDQKSYKDFNTSWPLNSWSVTENSNGYQLSYIKLLSKFVDLNYDCNGENNGAAFIDSCGVCAGGSTGIEPVLDVELCNFDCNGVHNGTAYIDSCGICAGGNTGIEPITDEALCYYDCNDELNGTAFIDSCGFCAGGNTGIEPITDSTLCEYDCNDELNGTAFIDSCGFCAGGNTGLEPITDATLCEYDCNNELNGTAFIDSCGICAGGNTGIEPITDPSLCETNNLKFKEMFNISIYPSPTSDWLNIDTTLPEGHLQILNAKGATLIETCIEFSSIIDVSDFMPGIYYLVISNEKGKLTQRFIVK